MRYLIYLLIVVNCVYFGWQELRHAPVIEGAHQPAPMPPGIRPLVTLQESHARQSTETRRIEEVTTTQPPSAITPLSCNMLGPFLAESALKSVEKRLDSSGLSTRPQTRYVREEVGYTVRLPAMEYKEALQTKRKLERENITANIIGMDNVISLGVFRDKSRAEKILTRARALGLAPRLEPSYAKRTTWWLMLQEKDSGNTDVQWIIRKDPDLRLETFACP
jgi:hypothetical protein